MKCELCNDELTKIDGGFHHEHNVLCPLSTDDYDAETWARINTAITASYHKGRANIRADCIPCKVKD